MQSPSSSEQQQTPLRLDLGGDLTLLRRTLETQGYVQSFLGELAAVGASERPLDSPLDVAAMVRRTAQQSPLDTLVRLFVLARAVPDEAVRKALAPVAPEDLLAIGLLKHSPEGIRSEVALLPFEGCLLARDFWPQVTGRPYAGDCVLGVGPATVAVANLTVRRQGELALDLGTGSGFHALLAARHAKRVIGTDINPRALSIAALNVRLNGLENIELREGSLYEPVRDCRFDLIVSNPPFVISPRSEYQYCDSGLPGDALSERLIRESPEMLCEGGYCTVLFEWHHKDKEDWAQRPKLWLDRSGCDAWLICSSTIDPVSYTSGWLRQAANGDEDHYGRLLDQWLAYYDRLGIGMISTGALILRRRSGHQNWVRMEPVPPGRPTGSCSAQIQRIFAAEDFLQTLGEEEKLLDTSFVLTAQHELEQSLYAESGRWIVRQALLKQTEGLPFVGEVDRLVSAIVAGCNGRQTLRQVVAGLAADLRIDSGQITSAVPGVVRRLLQSGFLTV